MPRAATARCVNNSPNSSPILINSERSSTYFPANGFSITATAAAFRVAGAMSRSISRRVSSTKVASLRIFAFIVVSPQPVYSFDLRGFESAHTGMDSWSCGHDQRQQNLIRSGRIIDTDFHRVEMAANVRGIDVRDGHIEACARSSDFLGGGHNRFRTTQHLAHAIAARHVPQRAVLEFAGRSHNCAFAVALD